jgi:hypothetical protein
MQGPVFSATAPECLRLITVHSKAIDLEPHKVSMYSIMQLSCLAAYGKWQLVPAFVLPAPADPADAL